MHRRGPMHGPLRGPGRWKCRGGQGRTEALRDPASPGGSREARWLARACREPGPAAPAGLRRCTCRASAAGGRKTPPAARRITGSPRVRRARLAVGGERPRAGPGDGGAPAHADRRAAHPDRTAGGRWGGLQGRSDLRSGTGGPGRRWAKVPGAATGRRTRSGEHERRRPGGLRRSRATSRTAAPVRPWSPTPRRRPCPSPSWTSSRRRRWPARRRWRPPSRPSASPCHR